MMRIINRVFALICITFGFFILLVGSGFELPALGEAIKRFTPREITHTVALGTLLPFTAFVFTFTRLGINTPEGEMPSPETKARLKELARVCPIWNVLHFGIISISMIITSILVLGIPIDPFMGLLGLVNLIIGVWFLSVYPVALSLFGDDL